MTAPLRTAPRLSAVPASQNQNTAPVAEFRCLFTHDLRRKQKRWQDGFLKFHTFNKRVMVYDQTRNFVGDTHYKDGDALHEGDELTLDKGVMVEVADAMGVTQTDLTPLFDKKSPNAKAAPSQPLSRPQLKPINALRNGSQPRHRSLNSLLGTPKGPVGKSVPQKSPYEARQNKENMQEGERATKRQRTANGSAPGQAPPVLPLSSPIRPEKATPSRTPRSDDSDARKMPAPKRPVVPRQTEPIVLDSSPEVTSELTLPSSPTGVHGVAVGAALASTRAPKPQSRTNTVPLPSVQVEQREPPRKPLAPPTRERGNSTSARNLPDRPSSKSRSEGPAPKVNLTAQKARKPPREPSPVASPPRDPRAKTLRLATSTKRRMLFCESMPQQRAASPADHRQPSSRVKQKRTKDMTPVAHDAFDPVVSPSFDDDLVLLDEPQSLEPRPIISTKRKSRAGDANSQASKAQRRGREPSPASSSDGFEEIERIHGKLDEQIVSRDVVSRHKPIDAKQSEATKDSRKPTATTKRTKAAQRADKKRNDQESQASKSLDPKAVSSRKAARIDLARELTPPQDPPADSPGPTPLLDRSAAEVPSRPSLSPQKAALSTGGFRKKTKKESRPTTESAEPEQPPRLPSSPPKAANVPVLPPQKLKGIHTKVPLAKPTSPSPTKKSPFRRVRSENDAPIPSTSAAWEAQNLAPHPAPPDHDAAAPNPRPQAKEAEHPTSKPPSGLAALVRKTDPRRRMQRTRSLGVDDAEGLRGRRDAPPPADEDTGPWSTEAFDLFDWRPPGMEMMGKGVEGTKEDEDDDLGLD